MKDVFGTYEIAKICRVTPPTVGRWISEGKLPSFKTGGGHRRVWARDLLKFLDQHNIPAPEGLHARRCVILIVDDEPTVRMVLRRALAESFPSFEVEEAADGFEAGRKVARLQPALVLLDLRLPGVDGLKVCRSIREDAQLKSVRVLAMSGNDVEESAKKSLEAGADDFIGKPFDHQQLFEKIGRLVK